jgi:type IV pilus assembly protein PilB
MPTLRESIIEVLRKNKRINGKQLEAVLKIQKEKALPLRKVLIDQGIVSEEELLSILSQQLYIPALHLMKYKFDPQIIQLIPQAIAQQYKIIPLSRMGNSLTVAMADPLNVFVLDDLKALTGLNIDVVLSSEEELRQALEAQYGSHERESLNQELLSKAAEPSAETELLKQTEIELTSAVKESQEPPIVKLVDLMLIRALKMRASDIHLEPELGNLRVRYRIDGSLHEMLDIPKANQNAVLARLKIISNLDITENRIPQDGRFKVRFENNEIDFRVSALPITFGQKFVLRLLNKANLSVGLDSLGFSEQPLRIFKEAVSKPFGMILVTGPTGSGKSTTLYSVLNQLNRPERNIITIEDPVEYQLEGITQVQVKPDIGLTFASGLRSLLRQSPDVIMVGEIRDAETVDIAIKAALTGQLIFSTLHTNDAVSSISRLIDMGVEPFLAASSLIMLCAQRLCRRLCVKCRQIQEVDRDYLEKIGFSEKATFFAAKGCNYCNNTGFHGRIAILEALMIDDAIREMIIAKRSIDEIKEYAVSKLKMKTLRDDAYLKVKEGVTTLEEAIRVTSEE